MLHGKRVIGTVGIMGGVPFVHTPFARFLADLIQYNAHYLCQPNEQVRYVWADVSYHVSARNSLVLKSMGDWILMLDCDQVADPDVLVRLLNSMESIGCDVLTAAYFFKTEPHLPIIYKWDEDQGGLRSIAKMPDGPFRIDGCGGGCLLVKTPVYDLLREDGGGPFDVIAPYSEDLSFAVRCRQHEIEMWCDPRIESRHLSLQQVGTACYRNSVIGIEEDGLLGPSLPTEMITLEG